MYSQITEDEFNESNPILRIITHDYPRNFGKIQLPYVPHTFTLCWNSHLMDPIIAIDPLSSVIWIGIDQRVVCVSPEGSICCSFGLTTFLVDIRVFELFTLVLSQQYIVIVNKDFTLRHIYGLRDIPDSVDIKDNSIIVRLLTGELEVLPSWLSWTSRSSP